MSSEEPQPSPFKTLGLPPALLESLERLGYETATPIQTQAIPLLLSGHDVMGIAQTGTGKTAAFALPALARLDLAKRKPQVLVLCPTRELSMQVTEAFRSYGARLGGVKVVAICGGEDMRQQLRMLREGVHVVVATPGRMLDHLERGSADFSHVQSVVLDEADEMLRMGFIDDVDTILEKTPKQRSVALFSATMPGRIRQIADKHLKDPKEVRIAAAASTNTNIEQHFWLAKGASKLEALRRLLSFEDHDAVIVFTRTRESTNVIAEQLRQEGIKAAALSGDLEQKQRVRTVAQLKSGALDVVVATDVAARGLDVERITHVINYDIPFDEEAYVHRIGRTGRAGRTGKAILFVTPRERRMLRNIERLTQQRIAELKLPSQGAIARKREDAFMARISAKAQHGQRAETAKMIDTLCETAELDHRAVAIALAELLLTEGGSPGTSTSSAKTGPYGADSGDEEATNARDRRRDRRGSNDEPSPGKATSGKSAGAGKSRGKGDANGATAEGSQDLGRARPLRDHPEVPMERFKLEIGRKHGVQAREIVGAIANEAGIEGEYIGSINIMEECSTVDLPEGMPKPILKHLKKTRIRGVNLGMTRVV